MPAPVCEPTHMFIEGDISDCFGSLNHEMMIRILSEKIHDNRFLRLIHEMLKAGYLEDWKYHETLSGAPQGSLCAAAHNAPCGEPCTVCDHFPFSTTPAASH